jgi:integrase
MLSTQALFILKRIKDKSVSQWVFPSNRPPQKAINQHSVNLQVNYNREYSGVEDWSAHDLRRTCRTHLSKLQCPSDIAEAVLGHTVGGVKGHYDLYKYEPEQKKWLQTWADHIDGLVTSAKEVENVKRAN